MNAGQITAEATLDISQVDAATAKLTQNVQQVNKTLESIKTPKLALDTTQVDAKTKATAGSLNDLFGKLSGLPTGKVNLDVGQAEQGVASVNRTLQGLLSTVGVNTTALGGLTTVLGAGGLVAAAGAAAVALAQLGAEFRGLNRQLENATGASGEALQALRTDFDTLFRSVPADGGNIVKAQSIIFQEFKQTGEGAQALVADLNAVARVTGGDLATVTRQAVDVFNAWNVATEDQGATLRDLVKISQATGLSFSELTSQLTRDAVAAQGLGLDIKEMGVVIDALGDAGVPARLALTALRTAMNNAAKGGADTADLFHDLVVSIQALESTAEAAAVAEKHFGDAGGTMARLIRSGRLDVDDLVAAIEAMRDPLASGFARGTTAAGQFQLALNNLKKDLEPAGAAVLNFAATFGIGVIGAVNAARQTIEAFMNSGAVQAYLKLNEQVSQGPGVSGATQAAVGASPLAPLLGAGRGAQALARQGATVVDTAQETQGVEKLTTATAKAAKGHSDLATSQANTAAASKEAAEAIKSLDDQLRAAGGDQQLIQSLLTGQQQVKTFDDAISKLTDRSFAAFLLAQRNLTEEIGKATGDWTAYDAVVALAGKELNDEKLRTDALTEAQKASKKATDDLAAAHAKAASAGVDLYADRLGNLANAVLPNLDEATAVSLKQALLLGDQQAALGIIAAATGQSQQELAAGLHGTGAAAAEAAKQAAAASKNFADILKDETRARLGSAITSLASATDALTASEAKHLEETGKSDQALQLLLQHAGAAPGAFAALKAGLLEGGAAAFEAREKIQALVTFVRDSRGQVRLKVDVDIENAQTALAKLQQDFREANAKRAEAETQATREFSAQQSATAQAQSQLRADYQTSLVAISQARTESSAQLGRDIQGAVSAQNDTLDKISRAREDAAASFRKTVDDTQDKLLQSALDLGKAFGDGIAGIGERTNQAMEAFANAQRSALLSLSNAMSSFNQQQVMNAFTASVALQNAEQQRLQDTGVFGGATNAERVAEIQRQGAAGLAQQAQQSALAKAQHGVAQQQLDATKTLTKAMGDLAKETQKLRDKFTEDLGKAQTAADKADRDAIDKLEKSLRDTAIAEQQANAKARDALRDAQRQDRERQKVQDDKAAEEQRKFLEEVGKPGFERANDPEGKGRTKAEQDFDAAERARREEQRKAETAFQEEGDRLRREIENNQLLKQIAGKLDRPNVSIGPSTIQETSKDMLTKAREVANLRLRV